LEKFVILEDLNKKYKFTPKGPKYADYEKYIREHRPSASALPKVDISPHDMVNVQFTSGSTGLPKNVALSHYNIMNCGRYIWQQVRMTDEDVVCLPVPLFHSFGMIVGEFNGLNYEHSEWIWADLGTGISSSTVGGSALVLPSELFNAEKALECIPKYKCTAVYGVPTMFVNYMNHKSYAKTDRSSVK
jgi:mevalonyl-CoA ligase